jgi:hypothetical protein
MQKNVLKKSSILSISLLLIFLITLLFYGNYREKKISTIKLEMPKVEVEKILGGGSQSTSSSMNEPICGGCKNYQEQVTYSGNAIVINGRLEDSLVICYANGIVCDIERYGL